MPSTAYQARREVASNEHEAGGGIDDAQQAARTSQGGSGVSRLRTIDGMEVRLVQPKQPLPRSSMSAERPVSVTESRPSTP